MDDIVCDYVQNIVYQFYAVSVLKAGKSLYVTESVPKIWKEFLNIERVYNGPIQEKFLDLN